MTHSSIANPRRLIVPGLLALVLAVFAGVLGADFVCLDDPGHVLTNPVVREGLSWQGVIGAFRQIEIGLWIPLTWISFMLEKSLYGFDPRGFHLVNLLIHAVSTALLFRFLRRATGNVWASALAAAIFGIHPLQVESVAWITERKNVLSTLFWWLSLTAWLDWQKSRHRAAYLLALLWMALGLMAKPMLTTLPATLLLLDFWPGSRIGREKIHRLLLDKIPFLLLSVGATIITIIAHRRLNGMISIEALSFTDRLGNAAISYVLYLRQMIWPVGLSILYRPPLPPNPVLVAICVILLTALSVGAWLCRKRCPAVTFGWAWYLVTLTPVVGFVPFGSEASADRYVYVPLVGIAIAGVWLAADFLKNRPLALQSTLAGVVLVAFSVVTIHQVTFWENSVTLFTRAVARAPQSPKALQNLGYALSQAGRRAEAIPYYRAVLRLAPGESETWSNLGAALQRTGNDLEAVDCFQNAIKLQPANPVLYYNQAISNENLDQQIWAMACLLEAIHLDPHFIAAHYRLGLLFEKLGQIDKAATQFRECVRLQPGNPLYPEALGRIQSR